MNKLHKTVIATTLLAGCASAHVNILNPVPFNPKPDTSPLDALGGNFPCKKTASGFTVNSVTNATVGQPIKLTFYGTANHNGGSCQVSLSKDGASQLNTNSAFKVIYSIMGDCPGLNGVNNEYNVPIPSEVPAGDYTLSWTWFNDVGNREMYQNCAPISISGGSGTDGTFNSLPDMAIYNIATKNSCKTVESFDVQFPNPGKYVLTGSPFKPKAPACSGSDGASAGSGSPSGSSSGNNGQYTPLASSSTTMATSTYNSNGNTAPTSTSTISVTSTAPIAGTPSGNNGSYVVPTAPGSAPTSCTGSGTGSGSGQACSSDGAIVCSADGTRFGLCNFGHVQFQPVASGTKCVNGAIAYANQKKRHAKDFTFW